MSEQVIGDMMRCPRCDVVATYESGFMHGRTWYCAQVCAWKHNTGATQPPASDRLQEAVNSIRARIKKLNEIRGVEQQYAQHRLNEGDCHGLWDSAIAIAEWEIERDALKWALDQLGLEL